MLEQCITNLVVVSVTLELSFPIMGLAGLCMVNNVVCRLIAPSGVHHIWSGTSRDRRIVGYKYASKMLGSHRIVA
jgi:hypothetical protein